MLPRVIGDRSHALGDRLILQMDAVDPAVDRVAALGSAVDAPIVACVRGKPPAAEPVGRVREEFVAAPGAADRRAVLEGGLRLRQRRYAGLPAQETQQRVAVVERHPGTSIDRTAERTT